MTMPQICEYPYRDGIGVCGRPELRGRRCVFHGVDPPQTQDEFLAELDRLIAARDGNWREFNFPQSIVIDGKHLTDSINLNGSRFYELQVRDLIFETSVDMTNCIFAGRTEFVGRLGSASQAIGSGRITFQRALFLSEVRFNAKCFTHVDFQRAIFEEGAEFLGGWTHILNLGTVNLRVGSHLLTAFSGRRTWYQAFVGNVRQSIANTKRWIANDWRATKENVVRRWEAVRNRTSVIKERYFAQDVDDLSTESLNHVFYGEVNFDHVQFQKPDRVYFRLVRLAMARVDNSDISKVHLIDVDWRQPKLGRSGLYEDVSLRFNARPEDYRKSLKRLEYQYQNIRRALEDGKMFDVVSDFYVGEMDCKRIGRSWLPRYIFSIPAVYNALSRYGTDPGRAFRGVLLLVIMHSAISLLTKDSIGGWSEVRGQMTDSVRVVTLQKVENANSAPDWNDTLFRILGPFQLALFGLSLRARIRRF